MRATSSVVNVTGLLTDQVLIVLRNAFACRGRFLLSCFCGSCARLAIAWVIHRRRHSRGNKAGETCSSFFVKVRSVCRACVCLSMGREAAVVLCSSLPTIDWPALAATYTRLWEDIACLYSTGVVLNLVMLDHARVMC